MSVAPAPKSLPIVDRQPDLIESLLDQQQDLTAVEMFSEWHSGSESETPVQEKYYRNLLPATPPGPGQQLAFEVDLDACSGCKACVVACHTLNGLEDDESWRKVGTLTIGQESVADQMLPGIQHVTTACHHCEDPGCLNGCPVKAYDKDPVTGIVRHLDDQCIGCKYCTMMCPYEVPQYSDRLGIVRKCDMCHQRLSVGEAPACVQSCPNEAIKIRVVDVDQGAETQGAETSFGNQVTSTDRLVPGAPLSSITKPTTAYLSDRPQIVHSAIAQDHFVDHPAESHWPLAVLLVATQAAVGMLLIETAAWSVAQISGTTLPSLYSPVLATAALMLAGAGLGIAPLHLGQPTRGWRVFLGLRTSWLSREGVVLGKFSALLGAAVGLLWLPSVEVYLPENVNELVSLIPDWAVRATLFGSVAAGLAGLYCSAMIYVVTRRSLWRPGRTFVRFFGTGLIGGLACAAPILAGTGLAKPAVAVSAIGMVLLLLKLTWEWSFHLNPAAQSPTYSLNLLDLRSSRLVWGRLAGIAKIRIAMGTLGATLMGVSALTASWSTLPAAILGTVAALCVLAGELAERLLYFSSVVHDRMPGTL